ncbi:hypothetical protein PRIC1_009653 [Phytophthora ramorum]
MDDETATPSPERDLSSALPATPGDDELSAVWLGDDSLPSTREALPAITRPPEASETSHTTPLAKFEENKSEETPVHQQERPVDESEVYFLIADFLKRRSTCQKAADTLIQELAEHQLLRSGVDWAGRPHTATYEDYRRRHRDISSGHLVELLQGAAAAFPRLNGKQEADEKVRHAPTEENRSLLLKARVNRNVALPHDERKKLAKEIVNELFKLRAVLKTLKVVEKVIKKYERYQKYTAASCVEELPVELQRMMLGEGVAVKQETETDKVTTLAADVRALKQLFQLRQERMEVEKQIEARMDRAKRSGLFQTTVRTGRNQASRLRRREVSSQHDTQLPPAYVYSRIRRLKTLSGHLQIQAYCLAYDKLGKVVITGSDDRLVKIWSMKTGDLLFTLRGHVGNITDLAVNYSNTLLASSSDDKTVRVWELSTGAPVAVLVGHSSVVNAVRFHPSKNIIVTASDDGRCFCYKVPEIPLVEQPETKIETARRLYALNAYMLSLHPIYAMKHARREGVRSCKVHCVTFSRCGDFVASGGHDGIARVWDLSMVSAPDAPAVVPRFQPTAEPQTLQVPGQQPSDTGPTPGDQLPPARIPLVPMPLVQANPAPVSLQNLSVQEPISQIGAAVAPAAIEPLLPVVNPMRLPGPDQAPLLPQVDTQNPLPTVAEALQREVAPRQQQPPQVQQSELPSLSLSDDDVPSIEPIASLKGHKGPVSSIAYNYRGDRIATASIKDSVARIWKWKRKYKSLHGVVLLAKESLVEHDDISAFYGVRGRKKAVPVVDTLAWTHDDQRLITLHSVKLNSESADPTWEQRIRVWEPDSGQLVMALGAIDNEKKNGHVNAAFALGAHPTDWRIIVTAGYDGRVFLWDISTGRMLKSFMNLSPDSKPLSNLDGGFTPDGNGFCFTDQIGRLLIFGTGSGEQYAATPVQQYFLHDYVMLVTDGHYNVRDRETQELPSLMNSGPLMDASLVQYPHQPPHLLSDETITPEEYEENRRLRVQQSKESEIQCAVRHPPETEEDIHSFPVAIINREDDKKPAQGQGSFAADAIALARASYRLNGAPVRLSELRRRGSGSRRHVRRRNTPTDERDTSVLEIEISSEDDRSDEDFQVPTPRHAAEEEEEDEEEDEDEDEDDLDEDDLLSDNGDADFSPANSRRRRLRSTRQRNSPRARFPSRGGRRLQSESDGRDGHDLEDTPRQLRARRNTVRARSRLVLDSDEEDEGGEIPTEQRIGDASGERVLDNLEVEDGVVVESNDGVIMGDNQLDRFDQNMTYAEMLEAKRAQLGAAPVPAENSDDALIPCALCGVGDDDAMLKLPGDGMGVHPLIYGVQRVFVHDQCAIASPLCFNRDGIWYNVGREIRRGRSLTCVGCNKRGATIGCTIGACRNSYHWKCAINFGWSVDQMHFFCPDHQSRRAQRHRQEENHSIAAEDGGAIIESASKRFGLRFHREWLQLVSLRSIHQYVPQVGDYVVYLPEGHPGYLRYGGMPNPRYYERLSKFYAIKCRVVDVKYVFPTADEYLRCSSIKCELSLAVLAVPTSAARPAGERDEQKQEEEESKEGVPSDTADLFNPESSPFAEFTSVDEQLAPAASEPSTRFNFKVLYHSNDVANFLVLDHTYESGVCGNWHAGDRVQMPFVQLDQHGLEIEAKMSYGTIESILRKPLTSSNYGEITPWECVTVNWDSPEDDTCAVCPWELESALAEERREKRELSLRRRSTRLYFSRSIIADKCEALLQEVDQVLTLSISRDFMYPVDEETFIDYPISIANPIDLTKIQRRLRLGYYRQVEAFLSDVKLISINCETYNIPSSPISQNSRNLLSAILTQAQRHFPHLMREANDSNRRDADGERAGARYTYPPDDFLTNFSEDAEELQLSLLEIGLLTPAPDTSSSNSATPVASRTETTSSSAADSTPSVLPASPQSRSRRHTRSSEETKENDGEETKEENSGEQPNETTDDTISSQPEVRTTNTADPAVFNSPRQLRNREVAEPQIQSPRARRTPRVVTTPVPSGEGPARKRQRKNPAQELLTYSALMENYTSSQRETIERAFEDDLRSVLQIFHEALAEADKQNIFAAPVTDDVAPQYSEIVLHPQDFGAMQDKLYRYKSFRQYFADVELVFSNAITYNTWGSFIGGLVEDLQKYCIKFLLDAACVNVQGHKIPASKKTARPTARSSTLQSKSSPARPGKQRARRKPAAASSENEEDSWHSSSTSESEEDDDDDDEEEEEDEDFSDDSDFGNAGRKRQLRQRAPKSKKKAKRRY